MSERTVDKLEEANDRTRQLEEGLQTIADWEDGKEITAGLGVGSLAPALLHVNAYAQWVLNGEPVTYLMPAPHHLTKRNYKYR